jgi:hypothetical protein
MRTWLVLFITLLPLAQDHSVPPEVLHKTGYLNSPRPESFKSAMLWGIAIADPRVSGYKTATVEISHTQLSCRIDGRDRILNDDRGALHGGLYRRYPWFGTEDHDSLPSMSRDGIVVLPVGLFPERVWHFWAASRRALIPPGKFDGCTVRVRVRISNGALLQVGMDYWRDEIVGYANGGNNHEAGASNWYFPSDQWQEAVFSDVRQRSRPAISARP